MSKEPEKGNHLSKTISLEQTILGAILIDKNAIDSVVFLAPQDFFAEKHARIFRAMLYLNDRQQPIDYFTLADQLQKNRELEKCGGHAYLVEMTNRVASAANIEYHARIIQQNAIVRSYLYLGEEIVRKANDPGQDPFELAEYVQNRANDIGTIESSTASQVGTFIPDHMREMQAKRNRSEDLVGIPSGLVGLDQEIGGWQGPDFIILCARPGMGKTAAQLKFVHESVAIQRKAAAIFSLEMSAGQLINRLVSIHSGIKGEDLKDPKKMSPKMWQRFQDTLQEMADWPLYIDDSPNLNVYRSKTELRRLKKEHNIQLAFIDYLQLMSGAGRTGSNREQEVGQISRGLKQACRELDIPIIALSQLSRQPEQRPDKRPRLGDLRESGSLEQDADIIIGILRAEYYGISEYSNGEPTANTAQFLILKNRHGALEDVLVRFWKNRAEFANFEDPELDKPDTPF